MSYVRHWEELIRRQVALVVVFASFPLVMVAAMFLGKWLLPEPWTWRALLVLFVAHGIVVSVATFRYLLWRCPACDKRFFRRHALLGRSTLWGNACVHCGLARYAPAPGRRAPGGGSLRGFLAYRRRVRGGRCGYCGYDLRGGHDVCPECGEAPTTPAAGTVTYGRVVSLSRQYPHDPATDLRLTGVRPDGTALLRHAGADHAARPGDAFPHRSGPAVTVRATDPARASVILSLETHDAPGGRVSP